MVKPTPEAPTPWVIVGCGRVGTALSIVAERLKIPVVAAWDRDAPPRVHAQQRLSGALDGLGAYVDGAAVILTVSDEAIAAVAGALAPMLDRAAAVVHCSGILSSRVLSDAGVRAPVASVHPLLAVADPAEAVERFSSIAWTIEGNSQALWWARGWLGCLDVVPHTIEAEQKPLYHAAAVTSAGLVVALMDVAVELGERAGLSPEVARGMLVPLARSAIENFERLPAAEALTGPVARDDESTIAAHLAAMGPVTPSGVAVYKALTERSREVRARRRGPTEDD